jgi:NUMOD3 motif
MLAESPVEEIAFDMERFWILFFGRENLTNQTDGGEGGSGFSEEVRRKMSETQRGNKKSLGLVQSEETRRKISDALRGRKHSEEHRMNNAEARRGKKASEETRRKMSESRKGRKPSEEHLAKIRRSAEARRGKKLGPLSEEHRGRISASLIGNRRALGMKRSEESKRKMSEAGKHRKNSQRRDAPKD